MLLSLEQVSISTTLITCIGLIFTFEFKWLVEFRTLVSVSTVFRFVWNEGYFVAD